MSEEYLVAVPVLCPDDTDEEGNPVWSVEIQTVGGWSVVAQVWGGSADEACRRADAVRIALARPTPKSEESATGEILQADREAAADLLDEVSSLLDHVGIGQVADLIRDGEYDEHEATQAFATHRLTFSRGADEVREALRAVEAAMLNGGDGAKGDFGWSITKLNAARPLIRAALHGDQEG